MSNWMLLTKKSSLLLLIAFCAAGISGCTREPDDSAAPSSKPPKQITSPTPAENEGHARMLGVLKEYAKQAKSHHPILGDKEAQRLRGELEKLTSTERETLSIRILKLHWEMGRAELRLGNLEKGVEFLAKAHNGMQQLTGNEKVPPGLEIELTYQLAIAYMRLGETQNCCLRNSPDSCLLPIRGAGIHVQQESSKLAITYFKQVLEEAPKNSPGYLKAMWLLNIMYMTIDGYPDQVPKQHLIEPRRFESDERFPRFKNISRNLGVDTFNLLGGAVVDDFTGDGYLDIVVSTYDPSGQMRFFRNNQDGTFTDRTEEANLLGLAGGFNLMQADYDNDGDLDILMLRGGWMGKAGIVPNSLLRNDGQGRFIDVTFNAGLGDVHYPTQTAAWADYDNDGDLDIYIGNEALSKTENAPCQLFRNNDDGTFTDVAREAGVLNLTGFTKGVTWGDYDADGLPDLYVSNLGSSNRLYRNNGDETFTDVAESLSVTGPQKSFPVWFWDFNNDGVLDIFVSSYAWDHGNLAAVVASRLGLNSKYEMANLYRGDGKGGV